MEVGLDGPLALVSSMIYKKISNKQMKEKKIKMGMVLHTFNPSTLKTETGEYRQAWST